MIPKVLNKEVEHGYRSGGLEVFETDTTPTLDDPSYKENRENLEAWSHRNIAYVGGDGAGMVNKQTTDHLFAWNRKWQ